VEQVMEEIRRWYNGYRFTEQDVRVYNPWSTLSLLKSKKFQEHWFTTGIPKMLVDIINRDQEGFGKINPADFDRTEPYQLSEFEAYDIDKLQLIPLMLQTGFLTFRDYDEDTQDYYLGYPNWEVRQAFSRMVFTSRVPRTESVNPLRVAMLIRTCIQQDTIEGVIQQLRSLIAGIPGNLHTSKESYYHSLMHIVFQMSGLSIRSEAWVSGGRMDTVIEEPGTIYIVEFKFDKPAQEAIHQIRSKGYDLMYQGTGKSIKALGISVDCQSKTIGEWEILEL
jgi:hypothetical protein